MSLPPLILGLTVLFWGWQTSLWVLAIPIVLLLEAPRWFSTRWDLEDADFQRLAKLTLVLIAAPIVYIMVNERWTEAITLFLKWLPVIFLPLVMAQLYGSRDRIELQALFALFQQDEDLARLTIDLRFPYLAACLLGASTGPPNPSFYLGMVLLCGLLLWRPRSRRFSVGIWVGLFLLAAGLGLVGHRAFYQFQLDLERRAIAWLSGFFQAELDPFQRNTSIGDLGLLKLSNGILFRVKPIGPPPTLPSGTARVASPPENRAPLLLREATYNRYQSGLWVAAESDFTPLTADPTPATWPLAPAQTPAQQVHIIAPLAKGQGLLKLPEGTFALQGLAEMALARNSFGTVKVEGKTKWLDYAAQFGPTLALDSPPEPADREVPLLEQAAIRQVVAQLDIANQPPAIVLDRLADFFAREFRYSLNLLQAEPGSTPLSSFLLNARSGHCEYFATATALLLRAAGIPARYAVGFSVHEFSPLERQYIVRGRHAHAWTLAYVAGHWQVVDNTPPDWAAIEDRTVPIWSRVGDGIAFLQFQLVQGMQFLARSGWLQRGWWLLLPILFLFLRQFRAKRHVRRSVAATAKADLSLTPPLGADSEFYQVERVLQDQGWLRQPSETLQDWLDRLQTHWPEDAGLPISALQDLQALLQLHYRYRFDPQGLTPEQRRYLRSAIQAWRDRYVNSHRESIG